MQAEELRPPCRWQEFENGYDALTNAHIFAMETVVKGAYPGVLDDVTDRERREVLEHYYALALDDFGFVQARGLELTLVTLAASACEAKKVDDKCHDCPALKNVGGFEPAFDELHTEAEHHGLSREAVGSVVRRAMPDVTRRFKLIATKPQTEE